MIESKLKPCGSTLFALEFVVCGVIGLRDDEFVVADVEILCLVDLVISGDR